MANLTASSTLADLPAHEYRVEATIQCREVVVGFEQNLTTPGVIVYKNDQMYGMLSRAAFLNHMAKGYNTEVYPKRPVQVMIDYLKPEVLVLPASTPIVEAARQAIHRLTPHTYDPIVVETSDRLSLIDMHDLLQAVVGLIAA
ncbi:MAG TPA: hypothetical protein DCQ32_04035 [Cyanobacteria bacterium UBA8156]|jgi:hypothetical protein|nr:hypothetical protein [Cyanobacteria bacterium UBA8156]